LGVLISDLDLEFKLEISYYYKGVFSPLYFL